MDSSQIQGIGAGIGGIGSGIYNTFFAKDPSKEGFKYLNQVPGQIGQYYNPYIQSGQNAMGTLNSQYQNLLNDPSALINRLAGGYQQSPGFNFEKQQGLGAIDNAAASGGMLGTPQHQQQAGELSTQLANKDFHQYLSDALAQYGLGLSGMQGMNNQGYNASDALAQHLHENLNNQSQLGYQGVANKNQQQAGGWGDILGGVGSLAALAFM